MDLMTNVRCFSDKKNSFCKGYILSENNHVYLTRYDKGKKKRTLLEKDALLYHILQNLGRKKMIKPHHLFLEITGRCNLNCQVCYARNKVLSDIKSEEVRRLISPFKNKIVSISGGEPTLHKELPAIIRILNKKNVPVLATNGVRLADFEYVKKLKSAGLRYVTFSFNGYSNHPYECINGQALLKIKLQALDNLCRAGIKVLLSMLLVRGINENEVGPVFRFAFKRKDFIRELRIRSMSSYGSYLSSKQFFSSEILQLICKQTGLEKKAIHQELLFKKKISELIPQVGILLKPCRFNFLVKASEGKCKALFNINEQTSIFLSLLKILYNNYSSASIYRMLLKSLNLSRSLWTHPSSCLKISVRSWPTRETLIFKEHVRFCGTRYLNGVQKGLPLCYSNILHS